MKKAIAAATMTVAIAAPGCTYQLLDDAAVATCAPLEFEINSHGVGLGQVQHDAIVSAFEDFGAMVGRQVDYLGSTTTTYLDHGSDDPILLELTWPDDAPSYLGYAEPYVDDGVFDGGWIYINPAVATAPAGVIERLVGHELGHLAGLDDIDDTGELMNPDLTAPGWGAGDLVGLTLTHGGGCEGSTLVDDLLAKGAAAETLSVDTELAEWLDAEGIVVDTDAHRAGHDLHDHGPDLDHDHDHDDDHDGSLADAGGPEGGHDHD